MGKSRARVEYSKHYTHSHLEESTKHTAESGIETGSSASHLVSNHKIDLPWHPRKREQEGHKHFRWTKRCAQPHSPQTPFEGAITRGGCILLQQAITSTTQVCLQRRRVTSWNIDVTQEKSIKNICRFLGVRELSLAEHVYCSVLD